MQRLANLPVTADPQLKQIADNFASRDVQVFMLSNQLPLLEAGREGQQVDRPDRQPTAGRARPSPGGSSPRPSSSRSPTRTT